MPPFLYFDSLYWVFMAVSLLIIISAQIAVQGRFKKYSSMLNSKGISGRQAAKTVLESAGIHNVTIERITGKLTDHYDPRTNVIRLSEAVFDRSSIAAVGIAAHEAGHAVQHAKGYSPLKLRNAIIPISKYGPSLGIILLIIGASMNFPGLIDVGLIFFSFALLFQLITLPVEFNASKRAIVALSESGILNQHELKGAKSVLSAAAMTYLAAMLQTLLSLLYYFVRFKGRD